MKFRTTFTALACTLATAACGDGGDTAPATGTPPPRVVTPDTGAPTTPAGLAVRNLASTGLTLRWYPSIDNIGVTAYEVYRDGAQAAAVSGSMTSHALTGLIPSTSYSLQVRARDAAGNTSSLSPITVTTTPTAPLSSFGISAVSMTGGILTVSGSGFGTRAQAAPLRFEDFESREIGALPQNLGYSDWSPESVRVDASTAFSGSRALRHHGVLPPLQRMHAAAAPSLALRSKDHAS